MTRGGSAGGVAGGSTEEVLGHVAVAKALQQVLAPRHRPEQALLLSAEQAQAAVAACRALAEQELTAGALQDRY